MSKMHMETLLDNGTSSEYTQDEHHHDEPIIESKPQGLTRNQIIGIVIGLLSVIAVIAGVSAYIMGTTTEIVTCEMGSIEDCSAQCDYPSIFTQIAPFNQLTPNSFFPDPYLSLSGSRIKSQPRWKCRRAEIAAQLQVYELGMKPSKSDTPSISASIINQSITSQILTVTVTLNTSISFNVTIKMPPLPVNQTTYTQRVPALIQTMAFQTLNQTTLDELGIASILFPTDLIAQQTNQTSRGVGLFYTLFGPTHSAGALTAWSWGISRMIDALELSLADHQIDLTSLGVTGCSRWGKGALIAGAFDERISLTIPQESGAGGSASWRLSDYTYTDQAPTQRLRQIVSENVWFTQTFQQFRTNVTSLPYDHHMLQAMVAPRGLLVLDNTDQIWLGNFSSYANSVVAQSIYTHLGAEQSMGVSQKGGYGHCTWSPKQQQPLEAYLKKFLLHQQDVDTQIQTTDGNYTMTPEMFVDWTAPW